MLLTEFCSWKNNNNNLTPDFQIQSMVEKLQVLELSEHVAGYCWFMAHGNNNYGSPYYRFFESNADDSPLTRLGTIYVYSSAFDKPTAEPLPISVEYYNLQGQRTPTPQPGICIVVTNLSDGKQQVSKKITTK